MHKFFAYSAFGWLAFTGVMHFGVDVMSQYLLDKRPPGPETTLYYGLHTAYATGQVLFGLLGLLAVKHALPLFDQRPAKALCIAAFCAWTVFCFVFIEYWQPKMTIALFGVLLGFTLIKAPENARRSLLEN